MEDLEQDRLEDQILRNRVLLTKVILHPIDFLDFLQQERYLNEDDVSEVKCDLKYWSRKMKIGALLDIIKIKGRDAIKCFLERLGWEYAHTYQQITGEKPSEPPAYFSCARGSRVYDDMLNIENNTFKQNETQTVINLWKMETEELERENEKLIDEKKQIDLAFKELLIKSDKLQVDLTKSLQDYVICSKERDEFRQNCQENALEKVLRRDTSEKPEEPQKPVNLVGPFTRPRQQNHPGIETRLEIMTQQIGEERQKCEELSQLLNKSNEECGKVSSKLREKEKQIRLLKSGKIDNDSRLQQLIASKDKYLHIIEEKNKECAKINSDNSALFSEKHELEKERDRLKLQIEQLELEKRNSKLSLTSGSSDDLESQDFYYMEKQENLYDNGNGWKANTLPVSLVQNTHPVLCPTESEPLPFDPCNSLYVRYGPSVKKQELRQLPSSYDDNAIYSGMIALRIPQQHQDLSGKTREEYPEERTLQSVSDATEYTTSTDVGTAMNFQVDVEMLHMGLNRIIHGRTDRETVTLSNVSAAVMKRLVIIGGNYTGIFVKETGSKIKAKFICSADTKIDNDLREGDLIQTIDDTDGAEVEKKQLKGATLDEASKIFSSLKEDCEVVVRRSQKEYNTAKDWMVNENGGHGDYFFVRCNCGFRAADDDIHEGDILCVKNTHSRQIDHRQYEAFKVDSILGKVYSKSLMIENSNYGHLKLSHKYNYSPGQKTGLRKCGAMRIKEESKLRYTKVLPVNAKANLPVILLGDPNIVDAVLSVVKEESDRFMVLDPEATQLGVNTMQSANLNNLHTICKGNLPLSSKQSSSSIVILLVISPETTDADLRNMFGKEVDIFENNSSQHKATLQRYGIVFDIIQLLFSEVTDKKSLIETLVTFVNVAQHRKYWLSSELLDHDTREKYSAFLDKPKHKLVHSSSECSQDDLMEDPLCCSSSSIK